MKVGASKYRNMEIAESKYKWTDVDGNIHNIDGQAMDINSKYMAVSWHSDDGKVAIIDPTKPERMPGTFPFIRAHGDWITCLKFSPFKENLLATCSNDCSIKLWEIPEGGLKEDLKEELIKYTGHAKRPHIIDFHPCCPDIAASCGNDPVVHCWNVAKAEDICSVTLPEVPNGLTWNINGSLLGATSKEKAYIMDPRANAITVTVESCQGSRKGAKMNFVSENTFVVLGANNKQEREVKLYDIRKAADGVLKEEVAKLPVPIKSNFTWSFFDYSLKLLYLCAKGEGTIVVLDLNDDQIIPCTSFVGSLMIAPCVYPKKSLDYNNLEIMRFFGLEAAKAVHQINFKVKRQNATYDPALYPNIFAGEQSIDADSWASGNNAEPVFKPIDALNQP